MLSQREAAVLINNAFPDGVIQKVIQYKDLFVFQVFTNDPEEGDFDPFFSVNSETGDVRDFSIITDGDIGILTKLFLSANPYNRKEDL